MKTRGASDLDEGWNFGAVEVASARSLRFGARQSRTVVLQESAEPMGRAGRDHDASVLRLDAATAECSLDPLPKGLHCGDIFSLHRLAAVACTHEGVGEALQVRLEFGEPFV